MRKFRRIFTSTFRSNASVSLHSAVQRKGEFAAAAAAGRGRRGESIDGRFFKVWTVPLEAMNCRWVEGRVPRIDLAQLRRQCGGGVSTAATSGIDTTQNKLDAAVATFRLASASLARLSSGAYLCFAAIRQTAKASANFGGDLQLNLVRNQFDTMRSSSISMLMRKR